MNLICCADCAYHRCDVDSCCECPWMRRATSDTDSIVSCRDREKATEEAYCEGDFGLPVNVERELAELDVEDDEP